MSVIRNSDIADSILSLLFKPSPQHILKLIERENILRELNTLQKLLNCDERFADSEIWDISKILKVSEIVAFRQEDDKGLEIKIPITKMIKWNLFRIIPVIFKRGSGLYSIPHTADYLVQDQNNQFGLITKSEFDGCKTLSHNKFACTFNELNTQRGICEIEILNGEVGNSCDVVESSDLSKIIRIDLNSFLINTLQNLSLTWGCSKIQRKVEIHGNAWIQINPGCYMDVLEQHFEVPIGNHEVHVDTKMVNVNAVGFLLKPVHKIELDNGTFVNEFQTHFKNLSESINESFNKSNVEIKSIILPKSGNKYIISLIIVIGIIVAFFGFRCFSGCSLLRLLF